MKYYLYKYKELCFDQAAKAFRLIEDDTINLIVNWENSMEYVEKLKKYGCTYPLMKQLAKFTVGVHRPDFIRLVEYGVVEEILEGIYVLSGKAQYDEATGITLDNRWMEEILMV